MEFRQRLHENFPVTSKEVPKEISDKSELKAFEGNVATFIMALNDFTDMSRHHIKALVKRMEDEYDV